jgi:hypothetical protein
MKTSHRKLFATKLPAPALLIGFTLGAGAVMLTASSLRPSFSRTHEVAATPTGAPASSHIARNYGALPIRFEPNVGQAPQAVKYLARDAGYSIALTQQGALLALQPGQPGVIGMNLVDASTDAKLRAEQRQSSVSNYFVGKDSSQWHRNVANFAAVRYEGVYPGVDWVVYGNPRQLEYDFVLAPQADPARIRLQWQGADQLALDSSGDLLVTSHGHTLHQLKPVIYQTAADGSRQPVEGHYQLDHQQLAFAVGDYDHSRSLVIDPALAYSTYLGGSGGDSALAVAVDSQGAAYVAGETVSTDFPMAAAVQGANAAVSAGSTNAFVAKFSADGSTLIYSTYLGGSTDINTALGGIVGGDTATGIAVDGAGHAYVTGFTSSSDFPTANALQASTQSSYGSAFVTELSADGSALVYSTYLGGSDLTEGYAIAVNSAGNAYVTGYTYALDFPTVNALQTVNNAGSNYGSSPFVAELDVNGASLKYSTYLGGSCGYGDAAYAIAVDGSGNAHIAGQTCSTDFPTVHPIQDSNKSNTDYGSTNAFVSVINATGDALVYSTYLGGTGSDQAAAIATDSSGNTYVTGATSSPDFPVASAYQAQPVAALPGRAAAFVSKLNADGSTLVYSTFLGGSDSGQATAIAVGADGNAYVAGFTQASDFPVANALQSTNNAGPQRTNAFIAQFSGDGSALNYSTYLGGNGELGDRAYAIALDDMGNAYVAGETTSTDFPTAQPLQASLKASASHSNAFVSKIVNSPGAPAGLTAAAGSGSVTLSWTAVSGAASYNIYQGSTAGSEAAIPVQTGVSGTSATITGLSNGSTYYFEITSVNAAGESSRSSEVSAALPQSSTGGGAMSWELVIALGLFAALRRRAGTSVPD